MAAFAGLLDIRPDRWLPRCRRTAPYVRVCSPVFARTAGDPETGPNTRNIGHGSRNFRRRGGPGSQLPEDLAALGRAQ